MSTNGVNLYKDIDAETSDQKRAKKLGMLAKLFHFLLDKESRPVQWCVCVFERERVKKGKEREICRERETCVSTYFHTCWHEYACSYVCQYMCECTDICRYKYMCIQKSAPNLKCRLCSSKTETIIGLKVAK